MATGYVTHGGDGSIWAFRLPILDHSQVEVARAWLNTVSLNVMELERQGPNGRTAQESLTLDEDRTIGWQEDRRWDELMRLLVVLPGETV